MGAALAAFGSTMMETAELPEGVVGEQQMIAAMFSQVGKNDLASFKTYLEENYDQVAENISALRYSYSIRPRIFADDTENILQVNPAKFFAKDSPCLLRCRHFHSLQSDSPYAQEHR